MVDESTVGPQELRQLHIISDDEELELDDKKDNEEEIKEMEEFSVRRDVRCAWSASAHGVRASWWC